MSVPIVGYILTALVAYLLGSIPTGFLVGQARGIDIRTVGSGNIGATNVFRVLGTPAGVFVLLADALKGWLAVAVLGVVAGRQFWPDGGALAHEWFKVVAGGCAILGHNFTCWLWFKGGKGIATSAGVLVALVPFPLLVILGVWLIVFVLSHYVSLASICASVTLPFATWLLVKTPLLIFVTAGMAGLAVYKHRSNIRRLLNGTENRVGFRKTPPAGAPRQPS